MNALVPRLRLDMNRRDAAAALAACVTAHRPERRAAHIARTFAPDGTALVALSVRSAFDLYLSEVGWAKGSEVLVTALTIPDMPRLLIHHGYVPVPVDPDPDTLAPTLPALEAAITGRTVAWLHAHLFGTRTDLRPAVALLAGRGIAVLEDCAQAYTGPDFHGSPDVAASFFSFGTIKTATAGGGAVVRVHDPALRARMLERMAAWAPERRRTRLTKALRLCAFVELGRPGVYALLTRTLRASGRDPDAWVHSVSRGFRGDLVTAIRRRPSAPLLAMLEQRLAQDTETRIAARTAVGEELRANLGPGAVLVGHGCPVRTHWVFPVVCDEASTLRATLTCAGFDATSRSSLVAVEHPDGERSAGAAALLARVVYVPMPAASDAAARRRLGNLLSQHSADAAVAAPALAA